MEEANKILLPKLHCMLIDLNFKKKEKALEVACGEGHVTREVLSKQFCEIDMFD